MKHLITSLAMAMTLVSTAHAESLQYTVEPSSGSTVKAGTTVNINFLAPDGSALDSDGVETTDNYNVTLTGTETSVELSGSLSNNYSTLTFGLPENLAAGDYTISIPEGKFYEYSHCSNVSPAISIFYTVTNSSIPATYDLEPASVTPANGSEITKGEKITLAFSDISLALEPNAKAIVNAIDTELSYYLPLTIENGSTVTFSMDVADDQNYTYSVTIAQGSFGNSESNRYNKAIALNYTVKAAATSSYMTYTVNPSNGSVIESGSSFTITFDAPDYSSFADNGIEASDGDYNISIVGADSSSIQLIGELTSNYCGVKYTLPTTLASGQYTIAIPEGKFYAYGASTSIVSPAISLVYTVTNSTPQPIYDIAPSSISPASGAEVSKDDIITMTFDTSTISLEDGANAIATSLDGDTHILPLTLDGATVTFKMDLPDAETTVYNIVIPQGVISSADDHYNNEIKLQYTMLKAASSYTYLSYTVNPVDNSTIKRGDTITITFDAEEYFGVDAAEYNTYVKLVDTDNNTVAVLEGSYTDDYCGVKYTIPTDLADGQYAINIPEGKFHGYNNKNAISPAIDLHYAISDTSSSIDVLPNSSDGLTNSIYDINGRRIESNQMGAGIYIVNGRKIVVR